MKTMNWFSLILLFCLLGFFTQVRAESAFNESTIKESSGNTLSEDFYRFSQPQTIQVTGTVTDSKGESLPGVNIVEKGTTNGVITDMDGRYSIEVGPQSVLVFSFIGFASKEVEVNGQREINVVLEEEALFIDEVVVTAMGVRSEKKRLNFAVQSVNSDEIINEHQASFVDALEGKISGLSVSSTGGSPSASSQMLIRGISSINPAQNNEPIFILNGMHVSGGASQASDLNPNDIENITVLKGAAAAALYGQEAANGAIIVTTKSGEKGDVSVTFSTTLQMDEAANVPEIQNMYLRGGLGVYREEALGGWGPLAPEGTTTYDNVGNFLQTGFYQKYDLSVSGGSEKLTAYGSVTYSDHEGVIPNDYLDKWGVLFKTDYNVTESLKLTFMADLVQRESRGPGSSSMSRAYQWPIDDDMSNYKNPDGSIRWLYIDSNNRYNSPMNPYWWRHEDSGVSKSNRSLLQGTVSWNPLDGLELTGRVGYDLTNSESQSISTPRWELEEGKQPTSEDYPYLGSFFYNDGKSTVLNGGIMARYEVDLSEDFGLAALAGADLKTEEGRSVGMGGYNFIVPEFYSINNLEDIRRENVTMQRREKNIYGFYGELNFDYKNLAYLAVTGRNDHSSTLPKDNRSYFYPSVSGGLIFSELFGLTSSTLNYGKLRGNWAKVGKDAPLYRLNKWFVQKPFPDGGYGVDPTRSSNPELEPEFTTSWEIGADVRLFNDITRLDVAFYGTTVENQIVEVRVSPASGNILQTRNEGTITNKGIEVSWDQTLIERGDFSWNMITNFGRNKGTVDDLPDELVEVYHYAGQVGDIRPTAYLNGSTMALSGKDYLRNDEGKIIVDEDGLPKINASSSLLIGNREPDFTIGWRHQFSYKNWSLSAMLNFRKGGDVVNGTLRSLISGGQAEMLEDYRNRLVLIDGVVEQTDGSFRENDQPVVFDQQFYNNYVGPVGSNFVEDGSFFRLGYVTLGYDMSDIVKNIGIKGLRFSLTGRNLFLISNYSGSDPVVNYTGTSGGTGTYGIDYLNVPNTRSFSFNLTADF